MNDLPPLPAYSDEFLSRLDPAGLVDLLVKDEDRVPRNVIEHCAARGEDMAERLTGLLQDPRCWGKLATVGHWWLPLHSAMILGLEPGERAGLLLVEFMRLMAREENVNRQDLLAGRWPALFANKPDSVVPALHALAEDRGLGCYIRSSAVDACIAAARRLGTDALEGALAWVAAIASNEQEDWDLRLNAGNLLLNFPREQYRPLVEGLARRQIGFGIHFSAQNVRDAYAQAGDQPEWDRFRDPWVFYSPEEIVRRLKSRTKGDAPKEEEPAVRDSEPESAPYIREIPKVGRNDPCPCGSGKKYKKCCMKVEGTETPDELLWHRMRRLLEDLHIQLLTCSEDLVGHRGIEEAWSDFGLTQFESFRTDSPHVPLFMPWFFHHWRPGRAQSAVSSPATDGPTVSGVYLSRIGQKLDPLLVHYLESCIRSPLSFHEVVQCRPGRGFVLRDILTGEQQDVTERTASRTAQPGDILFAMVVAVDSLRMVEASAPVLIPPLHKLPIIELRTRLRAFAGSLSADILLHHQRDLIAVYLELARGILYPRMPALQNSDGEPLLFQRLIYDIDSPRAAFDALKDLCITDGEKALLEGAEFDAAGELRQVVIPWQKPGSEKDAERSNIILGRLVIEGRKLTAEVNSENRARRFQELATERLGGSAHYTNTVTESPEAMMAAAEQGQDSEAARRRREEHEALNARPEVREQMARMLRAHYERWVEEHLPALGDRTPLQAMQTPDGREMVEALVLQMERDAARAQPLLDASIFADLRARLGLEQKSLPL